MMKHKPVSVVNTQSIPFSQKFAECCALKNYPVRRLYRRMMKSNKQKCISNKASYHKLRAPLQTIFRKPSTLLSIVDSHPEVLQFLTEFQPELDQILRTVPKSANWLSENHVPQGYWDDMKNQLNFFEWVAIHRGFRTDEDWYQLSYKDVMSLGGSGLLAKYNNSMVKALETIYPERTWYPFLFQQVPRGYWDDIKNQRNFFEWVAVQRGFKTEEDWYQLSYNDVRSLGGSGLLMKYNKSLVHVLQTIYPEKNWQPFKFQIVPRSFWDDMKNQRSFFEWVASQRGFRTHEDWYQLTNKDVVSLGGSGLLKKYSNSLIKALQTIYPERNWQLFLFHKVPPGYWDNTSNILKYMGWLAEQLGIQRMQDWYNTHIWEFVEHRGITLITRFGSVFKLLQHCYPDYPWDRGIFKLSGSTTQLHLLKIIRSVLKDQKVDVFHDYYHQKMMFSGTNRPMQLDIFIPQLNLAFEYQGEQHYSFHYLYGHPEERQMRDAEKKAKCAEAGITLIEVPYWWDKSTGSLLATIHQIRPDVISADQVPQGAVPIDMKKKLRAARSTTPSGFMLPAQWNPFVQPAGWWMSEMYSGVRALWNSDQKAFQLRNGKIVQPPKSFAALLSPVDASVARLDGVLWLGYGKQNELVRRLAENSQDEDLWRNIQYHVFDIPNSADDSTDRLAFLKSLHFREGSPLKVVEQTVCEGTDHLMKTLRDIETKGGEGVILKLPRSPYKEGVSTSLLKCETPKGKARLKSISPTSASCELASGIVFDIPINSGDSEILKREKSGAIVSFKQIDVEWDGYTVPRNSSLIAVRNGISCELCSHDSDLSWENVLEESTPYFLAEVRSKGTPKCVGCKQSLNKSYYRVCLQSLYIPVGGKPHTVMYQFCSKAECINKASAMNWFSGNKLIPKMKAVHVPSALQLSEEKLGACVGLNLLSSRPL